MIRQTWVIFILLFATIIVLAHAVIPHHHHSNLVCVVSSHCESDNYADEHNAPLNNHKHDGKSDTDNCVIKQIIAIPANQLRQNYTSWENVLVHFSFSDFDASNFELRFDNLNPGTLSCKRLPFFSSTYSYFIIHSLGLRAPPIA